MLRAGNAEEQLLAIRFSRSAPFIDTFNVFVLGVPRERARNGGASFVVDHSCLSGRQSASVSTRGRRFQPERVREAEEREGRKPFGRFASNWL